MKNFWSSVGKIVTFGALAYGLVGVGALYQESIDETHKRIHLENENNELKGDIEELKRKEKYEKERRIDKLEEENKELRNELLKTKEEYDVDRRVTV